MAKTRGFLFSTSAHGAIGKNFVALQGRKQRNVARWSAPGGALTEKQTAVRDEWRTWITYWRTIRKSPLTDLEQWNRTLYQLNRMGTLQGEFIKWCKAFNPFVGGSIPKERVITQFRRVEDGMWETFNGFNLNKWLPAKLEVSIYRNTTRVTVTRLSKSGVSISGWVTIQQVLDLAKYDVCRLKWKDDTGVWRTYLPMAFADRGFILPEA